MSTTICWGLYESTECSESETCVGLIDSRCVENSTVMWVQFVETLVLNLIAGVLCALFSWYRNPISLCGSDSRVVSTLIAFLFPVIYLLVLACQQPTGCCVPNQMDYKPTKNNLGCDGCAGACCNTLAVFILWPVLFCIVPSTNNVVTNMFYLEVV